MGCLVAFDLTSPDFYGRHVLSALPVTLVDLLYDEHIIVVGSGIVKDFEAMDVSPPTNWLETQVRFINSI